MSVFYFFFFFKQKTAYEIGTGDWSSDVCCSDLIIRYNIDPATGQATGTDTVFAQDGAQIVGIAFDQIGRASCRERV